MKIAFTSTGDSLDVAVDRRFGRCACFLIVDTESLETKCVQNPNAASGGGAGIQSAQMLADHEVTAVLTGNCGPNAFRTLNAAGIRVIAGVSGTIRDVIDQYKTGALKPMAEPNVDSHFGMKNNGV